MNNLQVLDGLQVLVVDDNTDNLVLIRFIFEEYNAKVTVTTSASAALEAVTHLKPNILISDIGMPQEDGYWLIRQIRNLSPQVKQIPAIALTAHASFEARTQAMEAGFSTYVAKPFDPDELVAVASNLVLEHKN